MNLILKTWREAERLLLGVGSYVAKLHALRVFPERPPSHHCHLCPVDCNHTALLPGLKPCLFSVSRVLTRVFLFLQIGLPQCLHKESQDHLCHQVPDEMLPRHLLFFLPLVTFLHPRVLCIPLAQLPSSFIFSFTVCVCSFSCC